MNEVVQSPVKGSVVADGSAYTPKEVRDNMGVFGVFPRDVQALVLSNLDAKTLLFGAAKTCRIWRSLIIDLEAKFGVRPLFERQIDKYIAKHQALDAIAEVLGRRHVSCVSGLLLLMRGQVPELMETVIRSALEQFMSNFFKDIMNVSCYDTCISEEHRAWYAFEFLVRMAEHGNAKMRRKVCETLGDQIMEAEMQMREGFMMQSGRVFKILNLLKNDGDVEVRKAAAFAMSTLVCCHNLLEIDMWGNLEDARFYDTCRPMLIEMFKEKGIQQGVIQQCMRMLAGVHHYAQHLFNPYFFKIYSLLDNRLWPEGEMPVDPHAWESEILHMPRVNK